MVILGTKVSGKKPGKKSKQFPILILGWGVDGADDVEFISRAFPNDHGLDCVKAPYADSRKVMKEISWWLKGNSNAQILYLGAHGADNGLVPEEGRKNKDKIGYGELGEALLAAETELIVWLGACESATVASIWNKIPKLPVKMIVGFADRPDSEVVQEVLASLIEFSGIRLPGKTDVERDLSYLDEDASNSKSRFPGISIFYRATELIEVRQLPPGSGEAFRAQLERAGSLDKGGDESFLFDEFAEHRPLYTDRNLESRKQKPKKLPPIQPRHIGPKKQAAK